MQNEQISKSVSTIIGGMAHRHVYCGSHLGPFGSYGMKIMTMQYKNWRGVTAIRNVRPIAIWYGSTEYHPEPQWLMTAFDVDKSAERDFAVADCAFVGDPQESKDG